MPSVRSACLWRSIGFMHAPIHRCDGALQDSVERLAVIMALKGTLQEISLRELFQIFDMGEKSGRLLLARGVDYGLIYVRNGQVIDALVMRQDEPAPRAVCEHAIRQLLGWDATTSFLFTHDPEVVYRPVCIQHSSGWLVLEHLRAHDPARPGDTPQFTHATIVEPGMVAHTADIALGLGLEQWRILDLVVRRMTIGDIVATLGLDIDVALRVITELVAIGLLHVVTLPPQRAVMPRHATAARLSIDMPPPAPIQSSLVQAIRRRIQGL